jgi:hypothetical protein
MAAQHGKDQRILRGLYLSGKGTPANSKKVCLILSHIYQVEPNKIFIQKYLLAFYSPNFKSDDAW